MPDTFKHNRPIAQVFKEYRDGEKDEKKVARKEIHSRFKGLDWEVQKEVLMLHLERSKTDRSWAYEKLLKNWDDCFVPVIARLWDEYKESKCATLVIKFMPKDFVMTNIDSLTKAPYRNYFHIAARFGKDKDFHLDKSKLSPSDYLRYLRLMEEQPTTDEVIAIVKEIVINACDDMMSIYEKVDTLTDPIEEYSLDVRLVPDIEKAYMNVALMSMDKALERLMAWDHKVVDEVLNSQEWKELRDKDLSIRGYNDSVFKILTNHILMCIDLLDGKETEICKSRKEAYAKLGKQTAINKMIKENPALGILIDKVGFETD